MIEGDADREQIRALVNRLALQLLGRHVRNSPQRLARIRGNAVSVFFERFGRDREQFCDTEILDFYLAAVGHEDISELDVPMDDALGMRRRDRAGNLGAEIEQMIDA